MKKSRKIPMRAIGLKRLIFPVLVISFVLVLIIAYYAFFTDKPIQITNIPSLFWEQRNETQETLPTTPEETTQTTGTPGGMGSSGGEGGIGTTGGGGGEEGGEPPQVKINYTLSIDSFPSELAVFTNYSIDDIFFDVTETTPYSVEIESDTTACVLLTQVGGSGVIRWEVDEQECPPTLCSGFIGCNIIMDEPHTAIVFYTPVEE